VRTLLARWLAVLLLIGPLGACQVVEEAGPSDTEPAAVDTAEPDITPEYVASLPTGQSRTPVNQLSNEVVAAETEPCNGNPDVDWEACVSARMLKAFDRYGFLSSHCRGQPDLKAVRTCVQFGRAGIDWLLAIGGNPDTDFDWATPEQSHKRALKTLNDTLTKRCEGKPEQAGSSCFTSLSAELLGLSETVAMRCAMRQTLEERGACIVDALDAAMYRAALAVLSQ
jgi:hypothetical protein